MPTEGAPRLLPWRPAATTCDGTSRAAADGGVGRVEVPRQNGAGTRPGAGDRSCGDRLVNAPCVRGVGPTWQRRPTDAGARVWRTAARVPRPLCSGALPSFPSFKMSSSPRSRPSEAMAGLGRRAPGRGQACPARKGPGDAPRPLDYVPSSQTLTARKVIRLSKADENVCCKRREICLWSLWFSSKFAVIGFSRWLRQESNGRFE